MLISASIVTHHSDIEKLRQAVQSLAESSVDHQLIIVDNDSDTTYVQQLRGLDQATVIQSGSNKGFGYGHNIAFTQSGDADYLLVMNPDVVIHEGCLESMIAYMDGNNDVGCCVPRVQFPDVSPQYLNKRLPSVFDLFARRFVPKMLRNTQWMKRKMDAYEMRDIGYENICDVPFASGCFMLIRQSIVKELGGFDERYFMYLEDCDLSRRIADAGHAVRYLPDATITHHWERGSHKSTKLFLVMIRSMISYFNKWGWKWL